jgi:hypothetical protein
MYKRRWRGDVESLMILPLREERKLMRFIIPNIQDVSFSAWPTRVVPTLHWVFIRLSEGYYHCDRWSSSRYRLLNLPETWRTKQHWQSVRRSVWTGSYRSSRKPTIYVQIIWVRWVHTTHDHPLYFVYPDLLVAVCGTSYGIRGDSSSNHT